MKYTFELDFLDERHVGAEVVDEGQHICIYTDKMHINVQSAYQLLQWLRSVMPDSDKEAK